MLSSKLLLRKQIFVALLSVFILSGTAWASDPDLEGRITRVDTPKEFLVIKNELDNSIGKREYRVYLKKGMISSYMKNDKLKVWLMADHKEAARIERTDR